MKTTNLNKKSNIILKVLFLEKEITYCELCGSTFFLSYHHRHKRNWYKGKPEHLLSSFNQVLLLCVDCHHSIEYNRQKSDETFLKIRGEEVLDMRVHAMLPYS